MLYFYLTQVLNITPDEASIYAEAVVNKDKNETHEKSFVTRLLQNADCADIMRCTYPFKPDYLRLGLTDVNDLLRILAQIKGLQFSHGDSASAATHISEWDSENLKKTFTNRECFSKILESLTYYPELRKLFNGGKFLSKDIRLEQMVVENSSLLERANANLHLGRILDRGIDQPECDAPLKSLKKSPETLLEREARKAARVPEIPTNSSKANKIKDGNPTRSFARLGNGVYCFSHTGLGFIDDKKDDFEFQIQEFSARDSASGFGKKELLTKRIEESRHDVEKHKLNQDFMDTQDDFITRGTLRDHNELIATCRLKQAKFLRFTRFANEFEVTEEVLEGKTVNLLTCTPYLLPQNGGIRDQIQFQLEVLLLIYTKYFLKAKYNLDLPVFEYNPMNNCFTIMTGIDESDIPKIWEKLKENMRLNSYSLDEWEEWTQKIKELMKYYPENLKKMIMEMFPKSLFKATNL